MAVSFFATNVARNVTAMSTTEPTRYISYYRVSTTQQGKSGLWLDAQRQAVITHLRGETPLHEFVEVESGRRSDRPKLTEALAACRLHRAILVIAKLDRLARNVAFVSNLMDAGVDFVAVDYPNANRLTVHILASVAEHEARLISERTKAALAATKAKGKKLGGYRGRAGTCTDCSRARAVRTAKADRRACDLAPTIHAIRESGGHSLRLIAARLNAQAIAAPRGGLWTAAQIRRALHRMPAVRLANRWPQ
jgi:DNA invertase Pin-like site-specific DNA recombinase